MPPAMLIISGGFSSKHSSFIKLLLAMPLFQVEEELFFLSFFFSFVPLRTSSFFFCSSSHDDSHGIMLHNPIISSCCCCCSLLLLSYNHLITVDIDSRSTKKAAEVGTTMRMRSSPAAEQK